MQSYWRRSVHPCCWMAVLSLTSLVGCDKSGEIRRYQVEAEKPLTAEPVAGNAPAANPAAAEPLAAQALPAAASPPAGDLQYEVPQGWSPGRISTMRLAAFEVRRSEKQAEVTVIRLSAAAGSLLENVNRWRNQIGLEPVGQAELDASVEKLEVAGIPSSYIRITAPEGAADTSTILAVVIPRADQTLFVKLMGDRQLAAEEQEKFEQFVRSIRFASSP